MTPQPAESPKPTAEQKKLARTFFVENGKMNAAKKVSEKARTALFQSLEAAGIAEFTFGTENEAGEKIRLAVEVATPDLELIDVAKLKELVDAETFLKIVTASKKAVEAHTTDKTIVVKATKRIPGGGKRNVGVNAAV